jgi:hypothetical protein
MEKTLGREEKATIREGQAKTLKIVYDLGAKEVEKLRASGRLTMGRCTVALGVGIEQETHKYTVDPDTPVWVDAAQRRVEVKNTGRVRLKLSWSKKQLGAT